MPSTSFQEIETPYIGIWIQEEDGYYWICDAYGYDELIGTRMPTKDEVKRYRDRVVQVHG